MPGQNQTSSQSTEPVERKARTERNNEVLEVTLLQIGILLTTAEHSNWQSNLKQIDYIIKQESDSLYLRTYFYERVFKLAFAKPFSTTVEPQEHIAASLFDRLFVDPASHFYLAIIAGTVKDFSYFDVFTFVSRHHFDPVIEFALVVQFANTAQNDRVNQYVSDKLIVVSELVNTRTTEEDKTWQNLLLDCVLIYDNVPFLHKVLTLGFFDAYESEIHPVRQFLKSVLEMSFKDLLIEIGAENLIPRKLLPSLLNLKPSEIDNSVALLLAEVLIPGSQGLANSNGGVTALTFVNNLPEANAKGAQLQACFKNVDSSANINWFNVFAHVQDYLFEASKRNSQPSLASVTQFLAALDFKQGLADIFLTHDWWFDKTLLFILQSMPTQQGAFDILASQNLTLCYENEQDDRNLLKFVNIAKLEVQVMAKISSQTAQQNQSLSEGDKKFDFWLAQMFEIHCTSQPYHVIAGALAIPDKSPYILDRINMLFAIIMDKSGQDENSGHLNEVLSKFKELDVNLAITQLIAYYRGSRKPEALTKVISVATSSGLLDELLKTARSIDYVLYLNFIIEATNFGYDLRPAFEADSKDAILRETFYNALVEILEARTAHDFEKGQQDQQQQQLANETRPSDGIKRIAKELEECRQDTQSGVNLELVNESDLTHLTGYFQGPPGTPYENGVFKVDIVIPNEYPFKPPVMKFNTKIYHPNISSVTGAICLDILKDAWTPILTLKSSLISLQSLLQSPEPNDPQDAEVAKHYITNKKGFEDTAAYWTKLYAADEGSVGKTEVSDAALYGISEDIVTQFENMGFQRPTTIDVLRRMGVKSFDGVSNRAELENKILEELLKESQ
ncbi:hypothetical protein CA3LBN_000698 [Candidozyma haemuli]|uniref:UBC core domain-containing protein n=1 Tax=Candidozyma haemuli TaxID=45357 RepID=A0ABX8I3L4_9ASCO|nr:hypothetical protein CA3LBN_000698 [[Candida] haemuloni]